MKTVWLSSFVTCAALLCAIQARSAATPGYDFLADANQDVDADSVWEDLALGNPSGIELLLDDTPAVSRTSVSSSTRITHAYDFPGGSTGSEAGATFVFAGTANAASFQSAAGDWSTSDMSLEVWFRPDVIDTTPDQWLPRL